MIDSGRQNQKCKNQEIKKETQKPLKKNPPGSLTKPKIYLDLSRYLDLDPSVSDISSIGSVHGIGQ